MSDSPDLSTSAKILAQDAEIGQDVQRRLHRLLVRLAQRHQIDTQRATDYLVTGVLFTAARSYDLDMPQTLELVRELGHSVIDDDLTPATRH